MEINSGDDRSAASDSGRDDCSMVSVLSVLTMSSDTDDMDYEPPDHQYRGEWRGNDELIFDDDDDLDSYSVNILSRLVHQAFADGDWNRVLERLESHPHEALCSYIPSEEYASIMKSNIRAGFKIRRPVFLEILNRQDVNDRRLPHNVVKAFVEANPLVASLGSGGTIPLFDCIEGIIMGSCYLCDKSIAAIIDAYPVAVKQHLIRDRHHLLPLHLLCKVGMLEYGRTKKAFRDRVSEYRSVVQKMVEIYPQGILAKSSEGFLPIYYISKGAWPNKSNSASAKAVKERAAWREGIFMIYLVVLEATCKALYPEEDQIEQKLLLTALSSCQEKKQKKQCSAVSVLIEKMPQLAAIRDGKGCYPLGTATSLNHISDATIALLLEQNVDAIRTPDENNRLPLHIALDVGRSRNLVNSMIAAEPRALKVRDIKSKLYPFMNAAVGDKHSIDTVFMLLRKDPTLASGLAEDAPWVKTERAIHQLKKEKDEWKAKYEECQRENEELKSRIADLENAS